MVTRGSSVVLQHLRMSLNDEGYVVRIRGLPWSCTQEEVAGFFAGENISDRTVGAREHASSHSNPSAFIKQTATSLEK